jgi:LEA14-like dessication related protein
MQPVGYALGMLLLPLMTATALADPAVDVDIVGVRDVSIGVGGASFVIEAQVTRGKWPPIRLRGLDYTVEIGGRAVGGSSFDDGTRLAVDAPTTISVPCRLDMGASAMAVLGGLANGDVSVKIHGEARASVLLFPWTFDFETNLFKI